MRPVDWRGLSRREQEIILYTEGGAVDGDSPVSFRKDTQKLPLLHSSQPSCKKNRQYKCADHKRAEQGPQRSLISGLDGVGFIAAGLLLLVLLPPVLLPSMLLPAVLTNRSSSFVLSASAVIVPSPLSSRVTVILYTVSSYRMALSLPFTSRIVYSFVVLT